MDTLPTKGQLERQLTQQIQAIYYDRLGHRPTKVTCNLVQQQVTIVIENSVTSPEQFLLESGKKELAEQVRQDLGQALSEEIQAVVATALDVEIVDYIGNAKLDTGRMGIIVMLKESPETRQSGRQLKESS